MIGLDLVTDKSTRQPISPMDGQAALIAETARQEGVLVRPVGTKIILSPPLTLTKEEADKIASALTTAFKVNQ